ncbi:uncharacterized protein CBL_01610 [Carabus blaptoides fortunei]
MSSEEDTRIDCKYGAKCYQKNVAHHEKYKHAPKRNRSPANSPTSKKQKVEFVIEQTNNDDTEKNSSANEERKEESIDRKNSNESEQVISPKTLEEKKQFIRKAFLVDMPDDFYLFWDFCKELSEHKPNEAFKSVGLILVGPYDVLQETFKVSVQNTDKFILHWRYYYDPPEFQTVLKGADKSGFHMGYFRDSPEELPSFMGSNRANKDCIIHQVGVNIFGAVNTYLEDMLKSADPFKKMTITKLQKSLICKAKELNISLNVSMLRSRKTVCKTFHTAGVVVPYNRKTELGYRKLPVNDKELRRILDNIVLIYPDKQTAAFTLLQPVLTAVTIANDECDFGTALEFGIDIFCYGNECFNSTVLGVLKTTYALLNRHTFADIIDLHLKERKKECRIVHRDDSDTGSTSRRQASACGRGASHACHRGGESKNSKVLRICLLQYMSARIELDRYSTVTVAP